MCPKYCLDTRVHYEQNDQLPVGLIAQLVEHCTGITGVMFFFVFFVVGGGGGGGGGMRDRLSFLSAKMTLITAIVICLFNLFNPFLV